MATDADRQRLYEVLCDSVRDAVFLVGADGTVLAVNARAETVLGVDRERLVGTSYTALEEFVDGSFARLQDPIETVLDGGADERRVDFPVSLPERVAEHVEARISTVQDDDVEGAVAVIRDVTDRHEREQRLERRTEQLAVVNRLLRHDVDNDVNVILGWSERLEDEVTSPEGERALRSMRGAAEHVADLTRNVRNLMDAIERGWVVDCDPVPLDEPLREAVRKLQRRYPDADIELADPVPDVAVVADELLESVFHNLVSNAVVHNDAETPSVSVSATAHPDDGTVTVSIADGGPGIPDGVREAIENDTLDPGEGTGVGLYLVASVLDAYGGSMTVAERSPRGTVVTVSLRLADA